jgi:hypothetical protein
MIKHILVSLKNPLLASLFTLILIVAIIYCGLSVTSGETVIIYFCNLILLIVEE